MQRQQGTIQTLQSQVQRQQGTIQTLVQVLRILHMTAPKLQYSLQELRIDQAQQREDLQSKDSEIKRLKAELGKADQPRKVGKRFFGRKLL